MKYRIFHVNPKNGEIDFDGVYEGEHFLKDRLAALAIAMPIAEREGIVLDDNTTIEPA